MISELLDSELVSDSEPLDSIDPYLLLVILMSLVNLVILR